MRWFPCAAVAVCLSFPTAAFADDGEGWFEEDAEVEVEQPTPEPAQPPAKPRKKRIRIVDEDGREVTVIRKESGDQPPDWARGRGGKYRRTLPAIEGEKAPPGYRLEHKNRKNLWIPGVVLLATGYAASALTAATALMIEDTDCSFSFGGCDRHEWGWGFLPLAGPFVIAADGDFDGGWRVAYALFGISQAVGLGLTIGGAASKRRVWVLKSEHRRRGGEPPSFGSATPELTVGPGFLSVKTAF